MASVTTTRCDSRLEAVEADRHLVTVESGSLRNTRPSVDFCPACFRRFLDWLDRGGVIPSQVEASKPLTNQ